MKFRLPRVAEGARTAERASENTKQANSRIAHS